MDKDKDKSAVADFLGEFGNKGEQKDPFKDLQDPFVAPEQATEEPVEPKDEKPLPFNKDPRVQKYLDKEISKRLEALKEKEVEKPATTQAEDDNGYYDRLLGNDAPEKLAMQKEYKAREERLLQLAEERAYNRLTSEQQKAAQEDQEAEAELENAFDNIEESYDVDLTSRNPLAVKLRQEFVSYVERIAPKDRNGDIKDYPDMNAAWEDFSERRKLTAQPNRAKELASRSMARSSEVSNATAIPANKHAFQRSDDFLESLSK